MGDLIDWGKKKFQTPTGVGPRVKSTSGGARPVMSKAGTPLKPAPAKKTYPKGGRPLPTKRVAKPGRRSTSRVR